MNDQTEINIVVGAIMGIGTFIAFSPCHSEMKWAKRIAQGGIILAAFTSTGEFLTDNINQINKPQPAAIEGFQPTHPAQSQYMDQTLEKSKEGQLVVHIASKNNRLKKHHSGSTQASIHP